MITLGFEKEEKSPNGRSSEKPGKIDTFGYQTKLPARDHFLIQHPISSLRQCGFPVSDVDAPSPLQTKNYESL